MILAVTVFSENTLLFEFIQSSGDSGVTADFAFEHTGDDLARFERFFPRKVRQILFHRFHEEIPGGVGDRTKYDFTGIEYIHKHAECLGITQTHFIPEFYRIFHTVAGGIFQRKHIQIFQQAVFGVFQHDIISLSGEFGLHTLGNGSAAAIGFPTAFKSAVALSAAGHVRHDIGGMVEAIVDGGDCRVGLESTIIDLSVKPPRLLRPGGVSLEQLREVLGEVSVDAAVYRKLEAGEQPKAPGMKYRHYSPRARVIILDGTARKAAEYVNANCPEGTAVLCFDGEEPLFDVPVCLSYGDPEKPETLAEKLFACLRELDRDDIELIYSRCPPKDGVGLAVYNRLSKAAGNTVIEV